MNYIPQAYPLFAEFYDRTDNVFTYGRVIGWQIQGHNEFGPLVLCSSPRPVTRSVDGKTATLFDSLEDAEQASYRREELWERRQDAKAGLKAA